MDVDASLAKADKDLLSLATRTGGRAYFPASSREFASIYREIASALRHQYVVGIAPAHDGQFHSLTVQVVSGQPATSTAQPPSINGGYSVFTRAGYMAPAP
jgi:hypothetical protein